MKIGVLELQDVAVRFAFFINAFVHWCGACFRLRKYVKNGSLTINALNLLKLALRTHARKQIFRSCVRGNIIGLPLTQHRFKTIQNGATHAHVTKCFVEAQGRCILCAVYEHVSD